MHGVSPMPAIHAESSTFSCWSMAKYVMKNTKWGVAAILRFMPPEIFVLPLNLHVTSGAKSWWFLPFFIRSFRHVGEWLEAGYKLIEVKKKMYTAMVAKESQLESRSIWVIQSYSQNSTNNLFSTNIFIRLMIDNLISIIDTFYYF